MFNDNSDNQEYMILLWKKNSYTNIIIVKHIVVKENHPQNRFKWIQQEMVIFMKGG